MMQEADIIDAARVLLGNVGISLSNADADGYSYAVGTGNGKLVKMKVTGPTASETTAQIEGRGKDLANSINAQMAGL